MKAYETTQDFKHRLARAERLRRGEGDCSIIGASHADPCVVRRTPFDCTAAIELAEQQQTREEKHT